MSVVVAEGVVELSADAGSIPGDVRRSLGGADPVIGGAGRSSGKAFLGGMVAAIGIGALVSIGSTIGDGIMQGVQGAVNFTVEGIGLASDLSETKDAVADIFGPAASASVERFASDANAKLGQTRQQVLEGAQTFGIFGKSAGLAGDDLSGFSTDFVTLASDMASFKNTSPDEAILAIGAALRGESEPIRQYGVLLDDATLRQEALKLGLIETTSQALTPQQRVLAAQAAIYAQTSDMQGNFEKTSGGLANQQRILAASVGEAQTSLGEHLLPTVTELMQFANDNLIPVLNDLIDDIGPMLGDAVRESTPAFLDLVTAVTPLIPQLVELAVSALPGIISTAELLVPLMIDWATTTTGVFDVVAGFFSWLNGDTTLEELVGIILGAEGAMFEFANGVRDALGWVRNQFLGLILTVRDTVGGAVEVVSGLPGRIIGVLGNLGRTLYGAGRDIIGGFIEGVQSMLGSIGTAFGGVMDFVRGFFPSSPAKRGPFAGTGWDQVARSGRAVFDQFAGGMSGDVDLGLAFAGAPAAGALSRVASSRPRFAGDDRRGGDVYHVDRIVIDASNVKDFTDVVNMLKSVRHVARTGRAGVGGNR